MTNQARRLLNFPISLNYTLSAIRHDNDIRSCTYSMFAVLCFRIGDRYVKVTLDAVMSDVFDSD